MWVQIHQFYLISDDDAVTLCCASESSDFLGDVSSLAQILSSFSSAHVLCLARYLLLGNSSLVVCFVLGNSPVSEF